MLIDQIQEVAAATSRLLRGVQCRLMEDLGVPSTMWRVLKAATVSKSPRCFLFSSDICVEVTKKEVRQRSWER